MDDPIDLDSMDRAYLDHQAELADDQWKEMRLEQITRRESRRLAHYWQQAKIELHSLEIECSVRATYMRSIGLSMEDISDMFGVSMEVIEDWTGEVK